MGDQKPILIIDDEPDLLDLLCTLIEGEGFETLPANNGEEGLNIFEQHRPGLVITDLNLPKKNGTEIITAVREAAPQTKIIVMSGGECPDGADAKIHKPIDFDDFTDLVKKLA